MEIDLKDLLSRDTISRKEKILIILYYKNSESQVKDIVETAIKHGLREIKKWNVSQLLAELKGLAIKLPDGWSITEKGKKSLHALDIFDNIPTKIIKPTLRKHASKIMDEETKKFVEEAISALELGLLRSAVVLSWIGAVSILYQEVINNHLTDFNNEASRRFPRWKDASNMDGLSKMKEYDFLQVLQAISLIGKNVKDELEQCLKLRNSCGHPNSLKIAEHRVASHIEILILNIYSKYNI